MDSDQIIRFLTKIFNQGASGQNFDNAGDSDLRDALVSLVNEVDVGFDSDQVVTIIRENTQSTNPDSEYVERRIIAAQQNTVDSDHVERRIRAAQNNKVDSEFVEGRIRAAQENKVDSDFVSNLIDSDYLLARNVAFFKAQAAGQPVAGDYPVGTIVYVTGDERVGIKSTGLGVSEFTPLLTLQGGDSEANQFVNARDPNAVASARRELGISEADSDWILSTIDSDYVQTRQTFRFDSDQIVTIIQENPVLPDEDSDKIATIEGLLGIGRSSAAATPAVDVDDSDFIEYAQDGTVLDNDLVFRFKIMEGSTQLHSTLVRVSEGTRATNLLRILAIVVDQDQIASAFFARFALSGPTNNRIEYAFIAGLPELSVEIEITTPSNNAAFTVSS